MKNLLRVSICLFLSIMLFECTGQNDNKNGGSATFNNYDFDSSKYQFNTPQELSRFLMQSLANKDSSKFLQCCISKEALLYMIKTISEVRKDAQNIDSVEKLTESQFGKAQHQFVTIMNNLIWISSHDSFDFSKATILKIDTTTGDWYKLKPKIIFGKLNIVLSNSTRKDTLSISQLVRLKGKWFIMGTEFLWQNRSMPCDKSLEEENKLLMDKANEVLRKHQSGH